jgi:ribonuclease P protein component
MPARPPRLKRRRDFTRVAAHGQRVARPGVAVQVMAVGEAPLRVGFTATKKLGNAVVRNRAKRRLREAARLLLAERVTGHEIVLLGREGTLTRPFTTLLSDMRGALKQAGVL